MDPQLALFIQQLLNGLKIGSVYSLVALGYTMVYGIIRLINFAHGDFIMVGAYAMLFAIPVMIAAGVPAWLAIVPAIVVCVIVGVLVEKAAYKPVREKGNSMTALITAIAMSLLLENLAQTLFGASPRPMPAFLNVPTFKVGGVTIPGVTLVTIAIGVVVMVGLQLFVKGTKTGKAMRAVSEDREAAELMGISVNKTISTTFAIGSALAAIAGVLLCSTVPTLQPTTGSMPGIRAFTAAVFGGIGSIPGAMLGGILLGIIETFSKAYLSPQFSDAIVFGVLIVILLVKPAGLLGKQVQEKV